MTRKIQYPASATINPRDLKNTSLKDARDIDFIANLRDTNRNRTRITSKSVIGLASYYAPIKAVSDGATIYIITSNSDGDRNKNGIVLLDSYSLEVVAAKMGIFSVDYVSHILVDENYLYIAGYNVGTEAKIFKVNKSTLVIEATYTSAQTATATTAMIFVAANITLAFYNAANRYIKHIQTSDMTETAEYTDALPTEIIKDLANYGGDLFCGVNTSPAKVLKISTGTWTISATWTGAAGENNVIATESDNNNLYALLAAPTKKLIKIKTSDMTTIGTYSTSADITGDLACMAQSKNHIRILYTTDQVYGYWEKISKTSMTIVAGTVLAAVKTPKTVIESLNWQHYIYQDSNNLYRIRRDVVDFANPSQLQETLLSKVKMYRSTAQSIPQNTFTKVQLNAETYDTESEADIVTNYRVTVRKTGWYQINAQAYFETLTGSSLVILDVRRNNTSILYSQQPTAGIAVSINGAVKVKMTAGQYIDMWVYHNSTGAVNIYPSGNDSFTFLDVFRIPDNI